MGSTDGQSPPPPFRSPVKTWHNDTYPAISPTRPELSAHGKRVVITGGGTGIGRETAFAFATAGASSIFLLGGRRAHVLEKTNEAIQKQHPNVQVGYRALDIADVKAVNEAAIVIGSFDILVLNAAYSPANQKLLDADFEELGEGWTTNVIGNIHVLRALLPNRNTNASVINVSTALVSLPTEMLGGKALTTGMKIFMVKMLEVLAVEVPDCFFVSFHPGAIETDMFKKSGLRGKIPTDNIALPAHFAVWLASDEARYLRGKMVWASWDVDELREKTKGLESGPWLTSNVVGWPFDAEKPLM